MNKKIFLFILMITLLANLAFAQQELPIGLQRLKQYEQQLASSITFLLAFFAGLISMTSPCGIALLPTFFSKRGFNILKQYERLPDSPHRPRPLRH